MAGLAEGTTAERTRGLDSKYFISGGHTLSEVKAALESACADPLNSGISAVEAFEVVAMKFRGESYAVIEERLSQFRRLWSQEK
jgi:hypothetical protein